MKFSLYHVLSAFLVIIFIFVLIVVLTVITFYLYKFLKKFVSKNINTNVDMMINRTCIVIERIDNTLSSGKVILDNEVWLAISEDEDIIIEKDTKVVIKGICGIKLIVKKIREV